MRINGLRGELKGNTFQEGEEVEGRREGEELPNMKEN